MTIIAALRENETSILMAADSGGVEDPGFRIAIPNKLKTHPTSTFVWATAGNDSVGEKFTDWMMEATSDNWADMRSTATEHLARTNGRQAELIRMSGKNPTRDDLAESLLAGWLDEMGVVELSADGKDTSYVAEGFHAIGAGKLFAYAAHRALQSQGMEPQAQLAEILHVAATMAPKCDPPIKMIRITRDGISEI